MNLSRILGCVGAITLCVAACDDEDVSIVRPDAGVGGSTTGGSGGSAGGGGSAGTSAGSGGLGGSAGSSAGSAGQSGSAGMPGMDPDAGDGGTTPGPYAAVCESYCAVRTAWATAATDGGVNCPGWDAAGCQLACEAEVAGFADPPLSCAAYVPAVQCFVSADAWFCTDGVVYSNDCTNTAGAPGCDSTCDAEALAVLGCFG